MSEWKKVLCVFIVCITVLSTMAVVSIQNTILKCKSYDVEIKKIDLQIVMYGGEKPNKESMGLSELLKATSGFKDLLKGMEGLE